MHHYLSLQAGSQNTYEYLLVDKPRVPIPFGRGSSITFTIMCHKGNRNPELMCLYFYFVFQQPELHTLHPSTTVPIPFVADSQSFTDFSSIWYPKSPSGVTVTHRATDLKMAETREHRVMIHEHRMLSKAVK